MSNKREKKVPAEAAEIKIRVHPDVYKLGFVSLLTDFSSEMIFSVFAIFFTTVVGASAALLGVVEGFADLSASSLNYLSGWMSDRTGKRKVFALTGYAFSTLAKSILIFTSSIIGLSAFRIVERLGKSFRGAPRDAWLSTVADKANRGYSFGIHKALDKTGAIVGPLVAYGLLQWLGDGRATFEMLFWVALIPAIISVLVLMFIKDQPGTPHQRENMFKTWDVLSPQFKRYLIVASIFSLAYFSFGFLLLRAHSTAFGTNEIVLLYALFNLSFAITAPLIGRLGDIIGRARIIVLGYLIYMLMSLGFAFAVSQWQIIVLFVIYGLFYAIDEAQSKAFIADIEPERRASAIGIYNFATGMIYLPASVIAGALWLRNPDSSFFLAALIALASIVAFLRLRPDRQQSTKSKFGLTEGK